MTPRSFILHCKIEALFEYVLECQSEAQMGYSLAKNGGGLKKTRDTVPIRLITLLISSSRVAPPPPLPLRYQEASAKGPQAA